VIDTNSKRVLSATTTNGRVHDFRIYKESRPLVKTTTDVLGDTGYQGIQKIHPKSTIPHKKKRGVELSKDDKKFNHTLSSKRIEVEHVIGRIKRFRILADRYRNRRKRFGLRFKLIAGFYNYELLA
jgi:IS5 family transposase